MRSRKVDSNSTDVGSGVSIVSLVDSVTDSTENNDRNAPRAEPDRLRSNHPVPMAMRAVSMAQIAIPIPSAQVLLADRPASTSAALKGTRIAKSAAPAPAMITGRSILGTGRVCSTRRRRAKLSRRSPQDCLSIQPCAETLLINVSRNERRSGSPSCAQASNTTTWAPDPSSRSLRSLTTVDFPDPQPPSNPIVRPPGSVVTSSRTAAAIGACEPKTSSLAGASSTVRVGQSLAEGPFAVMIGLQRARDARA